MGRWSVSVVARGIVFASIRANTFGVGTAAGVMIAFLIVQPLRSSRQTPREYFESQCK